MSNNRQIRYFLLNMRELRKLFENNKSWVKKKTSENPKFFSEHVKDQKPNYLWIGCSDSRVPANEIVALEPGELFVHRNVANIFPHTDFNCLSVLEFAVVFLKIKHVIVCGHYGCGGVKAAMEQHKMGLVDNWLRNIRDIYAQSKKELEKIEDEKKRHKRVVELNVLQQVKNVCHTTIVQGAWAKKQKLFVHGWVYDLESGLLKDLNCCISTPAQLEEIYRISFHE